MKEKNCDDIINTKYPFPLLHMRMSISDRAAQFSAFKALSGYDVEVEEAARVTYMPVELAENAKECLNVRLQIIQENVVDQPLIRIVYFVPDDKKTGGKYVSVTERVKKVDKNKKTVQMITGLIIPIEDIYKLEGNLFERTEI